MDQVKKAFHAVVGSGDFLMEKSREITDTARRSSLRTYKELAGRGEKVVNRVRRAKPAKRATEGTKQAKSQLKGAYTSLRKAVGAEPATRSSSRKAS